MRVLVTWGSKRGGTEGIGRIVADALRARGHDVTACATGEAPPPDAFEAAVIGGALYANRWHVGARRYASRYAKALHRMPVWLFSSGPLDHSADPGALAPTNQVAVIMARVGALGHATFGGRLAHDAKGFPAAAMAKTRSGDWRNPERIRTWAGELADLLPLARPGVALEPPSRGVPRMLAHAFVGWSACGIVLAVLLAMMTAHVAFAIHAAVAPLVFAVVAQRYFRPQGAREPLPTALAFAGVVGALDLGLALGVLRDGTIVRGVTFWLPLVFIVLVTWAIGGIRSTLPWPKPPRGADVPG